MSERTKKIIFITLFSILYAFTGFVSIWHAVGFFSLANPLWLSWILAMVFEVGQAAVLFSILTSGGRGWMSWVLMIILTLVQVMGNVYSSYEWLCLRSAENLRYFTEPILGWLFIPSVQSQTIAVAYITGAILPIVALCLTGIVARYISPAGEIVSKDDIAPKGDISPDGNINTEEKEDILKEEKGSSIENNFSKKPKFNTYIDQ